MPSVLRYAISTKFLLFLDVKQNTLLDTVHLVVCEKCERGRTQGWWNVVTCILLVSVHTVNITTSGSPVAGQMYTLICNGTLVGNTSLTPVVTWRNSTGVVTNGNDITVSNGILTFNPLHTSHGGQYTCQSTLSSPLSSTTTALMSVTVLSK